VSFAYLAALVVSIAGLGFLDWRYRVAVFAQPRRALATVGIGVAVFLAWDVAGVGLGIFFRGDAGYMTGVQLAPEVPLEELFFLILLNYQTLLLWRALDRRRARAGNAGVAQAGSAT
jgi:lycopene cyclase domain-containing protein